MYTNTTKEAKKIKIIFEDLVSHMQIFSLKFFSWNTIIEVKKQLQKHIKTSHHNMRLFYKNIELNKNGRRILDYHIKNRDMITIKMTPQLQNSLGILNPYQIFQSTPIQIQEMFQNVKNGFLKGIKPKLTENGTSGSYFLENQVRRNVAIFKPFDQQAFAPNNPRNYIGNLGDVGFRRGILSGESATRQVAAYMVNDNYHGVPPTTYVQFYHPSFESRQHEQQFPIKSQTQFQIKNVNNSKTKHGSLQIFVSSDDIIGNFGSNIFSVQQIHKIAILDIRILNCDRNQQNILVKKSVIQVQTSTGYKPKKDYKLIPIDHGLSFPDNFQIYDYQVIWMEYNQTRQPFTQKQLKFIESINPIEDVKKLRDKLGFRHICLRNFRIAETLLKKAAKLGFNLNQIGHMLYRKEQQSDDEIPQHLKKNRNLSEIQKLVNEAQNIYFLVKQNGIKSTIQYRIGLIKNRQSKNLQKNGMKLIEIKQKQKEDSQQQSPMLKPKNPHNCNNQVIKQKQNKRSISLPIIKRTIVKEEKEKQKEKANKNIQKQQKIQQSRRNEERTNSKYMEEQWEEIFYHYFEDILDRYLKQKKKTVIKRQRFRSQFIEQ